MPVSLKIQSQKQSFGIIINGDRQKSSLKHGIAENVRWKVVYVQNVTLKFDLNIDFLVFHLDPIMYLLTSPPMWQRAS